jgi:hypothetical protein
MNAWSLVIFGPDHLLVRMVSGPKMVVIRGTRLLVWRGAKPYATKCVEWGFSEVRFKGILGRSSS